MSTSDVPCCGAWHPTLHALACVRPADEPHAEHAAPHAGHGRVAWPNVTVADVVARWAAAPLGADYRVLIEWCHADRAAGPAPEPGPVTRDALAELLTGLLGVATERDDPRQPSSDDETTAPIPPPCGAVSPSGRYRCGLAAGHEPAEEHRDATRPHDVVSWRSGPDAPPVPSIPRFVEAIVEPLIVREAIQPDGSTSMRLERFVTTPIEPATAEAPSAGARPSLVFDVELYQRQIAAGVGAATPLLDATHSDLDDYQRRVSATVSGDRPTLTDFYALALAEECGEVIKPLRKFLACDAPVDLAELAEELGDVLNNVANLGRVWGLTLRQIAAADLAKHARRLAADGPLDLTGDARVGGPAAAVAVAPPTGGIIHEE